MSYTLPTVLHGTVNTLHIVMILKAFLALKHTSCHLTYYLRKNLDLLELCFKLCLITGAICLCHYNCPEKITLALLSLSIIVGLSGIPLWPATELYSTTGNLNLSTVNKTIHAEIIRAMCFTSAHFDTKCK